MAFRRADIVWSPEAVEALGAVTSRQIQTEIVRRVELASMGPGLHKARPTATWGTVYLFHQRPFVVVYRFRNEILEVLDIVDATFIASYEIKE